MGITNSNKVINLDRIDCDGSLRVTLALTAAPDIITNPTDIALVLDRSGSMTGSPMAVSYTHLPRRSAQAGSQKAPDTAPEAHPRASRP